MNNSTNEAKKSVSVQKQFFNLISSLCGQDNILTIPRMFIDFTGSHTAALLLSQMLFRQGQKGEREFFWKTYADWKKETALEEHEVRRISKSFKDRGILETKIKKVQGNPTLHFRINIAELHKQLSSFLTNLSFLPSDLSGTNLTNPQERTLQNERNLLYTFRDDGSETTVHERERQGAPCPLRDFAPPSAPLGPLAAPSLSPSDSSIFDSLEGKSSTEKEKGIEPAPIPASGAPAPTTSKTKDHPQGGLPPSAKQIAYARSLGIEHSIPLPPGIETDLEVCSAFISRARHGKEKMVSDGRGSEYPLKYIMEKYRCSEKTASMWAREETERIEEEMARGIDDAISTSKEE